MILSRRVALNGVQLDQIDNAIVIRKVDAGAPTLSVNAVSRMGSVGQRVTSEHWEMLEVMITYAIDLGKRQMARRKEIFDAVNAWAMGKGWLTVNWMTNRRMWVDKVIVPNGGDMWDWTGEYTIVFRAYSVPFWQEENPASVAANLTSGSVVLGVGGNVQTVIDLTFKNTSGSTINTFSVSAGGNTISLSDIGLLNGETLQIHHGTDGLLRIVIGSRSVYNKRAAGGADDLYVQPGNVTVSVTAGGSGRLIVTCCGRYV